MPNGTLEYNFNYSFSGKEFCYGVIGTSQGGSHPRVGARCYLPNKIFNKFTQNNLFFDQWWRFQVILWKILGWLTRLGYLMFCFLRKFESFSFWWLRQVFQQLISHRKSHLSTANSLMQEHDYPPKARSLCYWLKFW